MSEAKKPWRQQLPDFLQFLDRDLSYAVRRHEKVLDFDVYLVDFAAWKLRFTDRTPVIWVSPADAQAMSANDLAQSLVDVVRARGLAERNPLALVPIPAGPVRACLERWFLPIIVLDAADLQAIRESRRPSGEMLDRISPQLPLSLLAPYEISKPVTGSRFFGREFEIRRILQGSDSNFALMGIRRIGKTSLMREIERRLREQALESDDEGAAERILFMDCSVITSPSHFLQEVVRKLHPQDLARLEHRQFPIYFPDFMERMAQRYGGPLVFLLDEFDEILSWHSKDGQGLLPALRASSNMGHSRYIVAGFRQVMRAASDLNSPLYNFAKPIRLKEFNRDQAADMILAPLEKLRIHFERRNEIVDRIFNETAGQPNLIQFYCSILVEQMDLAGVRTLSPDSLFDVYGNEDFRSFVINTFMDNTTHLEKAVVFAVMADHGDDEAFGLQAIDKALRGRNLQAPLADLDPACQNLELAGIFTLQGNQYRFATPVFPRVLKETYDVGYLFEKIVDEGIW